MKKLTKDFFQKPRPKAPKEKSDLIPFKWSKEVLSGKYKDKTILGLPKSN